MTRSENPLESIEKEADQVEAKYAANAEVYADSRSEAAQIAGNQAAKEHWDEVADTLREGADDDDDG